MEVRRLSLNAGAEQAEGVVVIIDVFRAFTLEACLFAQGMEAIYPVGDYRRADDLKEQLTSCLTFGERGGIQLEGFDYGNSPYNIYGVDFTGKVGIHTTSAGTQGLVAAQDAQVLLTGSFVNAKATVEYIKSLKPDHVSLVAMGSHGLYKTEEDELCAEYLETLLMDQASFTEAEVKSKLFEAGRIFFDPKIQESMPKGDFDLCTMLNCFDFAIEVVKTELGLCSKKVNNN